jgi:aspartate racemase
LLATSGTVASRVYHDAARGSPFDVIVPDDAHQAEVMDAIYGSRGVKAGYTEGRCKESLLNALAHLARRGAGVVILGCTELPLVLPEHPAFDVAGKTVVLLDPTAILARRCVALAGVTNARAAGRPANGAAAMP